MLAQRFGAINRIPGPPAFPIIGSTMYGLAPNEIARRYVPEIVSKYGQDGLVRGWLGPIPLVEVFEPDTVRQIVGTAACLAVVLGSARIHSAAASPPARQHGRG